MRIISFLLSGILFGIILTKAEVISWFRIIEMFRFESFHMYGVIGTAVVFGVFFIWLMKKLKIKTLNDALVKYPKPLPLNVKRHLLAGTIFGLGWALVGACPGPIYALLGQGYSIILLALVGGAVGAFAYGMVREKLPH
jgi:uncharacterized membrane protein YedE/YeeE